jgi:hypothetical protein
MTMVSGQANIFGAGPPQPPEEKPEELPRQAWI